VDTGVKAPAQSAEGAAVRRMKSRAVRRRGSGMLQCIERAQSPSQKRRVFSFMGLLFHQMRVARLMSVQAIVT
jgi:hypothetical protein